jgi:hypothetical protein
MMILGVVSEVPTADLLCLYQEELQQLVLLQHVAKLGI